MISHDKPTNNHFDAKEINAFKEFLDENKFDEMHAVKMFLEENKFTEFLAQKGVATERKLSGYARAYVNLCTFVVCKVTVKRC